MDEVEHRLAAVELVLMETLAELSDEQRERIGMRLATIAAGDADEVIIRAQAQALLGDANRRLDTFSGGARVRPEAND